MGGSLGQALRRTRRYRVLGIARKTRTLREAKRLRAIDEGSTDFSAVRDADLVVVCSPVDTIVPIVKRLQPYLASTTIVTDVGSVKSAIVNKIKHVRFVGGHPLAGSHKTGVSAACPTLFHGATCVLMSDDKTALGVVRRMWLDAGAKPLIMAPEDHDAAVALTSHLPHLLAHALVRAAAKRPHQKTLKSLMAGSFRDMTRVASSDPDQWVQIFQANLKPLRHSIRWFRQSLSQLERHLNRPKLATYLKTSRAYRKPLFHGI